MCRCYRVVMLIAAISASLFVDVIPAQTSSNDITTDTPQSKSAVLPVEAFIKYDEFGGIKLSPSGKYAVFMTGKYGRSLLVFMTVADRKGISSVRCPDDFEFYDFDWISDRRIVYQIAERQPSGLLAKTGEMFATDVDGKNRKFIYGYRAGRQRQQTGSNISVQKSDYGSAELINPLLNDKKQILIREMKWKQTGSIYYYDPDAKPIISLLNVYTGRKRKLDVAPFSDATVLTDHQDRVRFAVGVNAELRYTASYKPDPDDGWVDFDLPGFCENSILPIIMSKDARSVYFVGTASDTPFSALFRLDLQTREVSRLFGFDDSNISDIVFDLKGERILGVESYIDKPVTHWLDKKDRETRILMSLAHNFAPQTFRFVTATEDGHLGVFLVNSDTNPGDFYFFNADTVKADYLQPARAWINPDEMCPKQPFTLEARDGLTLHGYVTRPKGPGPYPMVVFPHGGPYGVRNSWEFDSEVQLLANRGYAVLQVNYRGSGGFGDAFKRLGYRQWGGKIQDDITDVTLWAIDRKIALPDRICIFGNSFGAYAALEGIIREPALYRCAVGNAGIYDLELMFSTADTARSDMGQSYLQTVLGSDTSLLKAWSPVHTAEKIQVPVLLIHGKEDWRADFKQAKRMKAALEENNKTFEWMALRGEGHGIHDEETRTEVYERIIEFLDQHLKTTVAANTAVNPGR